LRREAQAVARAKERGVQTAAERRASSGDFTALTSNHRAARTVLEPNIGEAERLAQSDEAEVSDER
jgi:hypothetical protein